VVLITQRSQVQILPPLPRPEAGSQQGTGLLLAVCARALFAPCLADPVVVVRLILDTAHQQSADDQVGERVRSHYHKASPGPLLRLMCFSARTTELPISG